jgi:hypothetical protein
MTASCDLRHAACSVVGPPQQDAAASISGSSTSTAAPPQLTALAAEAYRARTASRTLSPSVESITSVTVSSPRIDVCRSLVAG